MVSWWLGIVLQKSKPHPIDSLVLPIRAKLKNLSETSFAKFGAVPLVKSGTCEAMSSNRLANAQVVLTKYDNIPASFYTQALEKYSSIKVDRIVRTNKDGTQTWWNDEGKIIPTKSLAQSLRPPHGSPGSTFALVSCENFHPPNGLIDSNPSWAWSMRGQTAVIISNFGPNRTWVTLPKGVKKGVTIPIWLNCWSRHSETMPIRPKEKSSIVGLDLEVVSVESQTITVRQRGRSSVGYYPAVKQSANMTMAVTSKQVAPDIIERTYFMECPPTDWIGFKFTYSALFFGFIEGVPSTPNTEQ